MDGSRADGGILVVSDSFHSVPEAVELLAETTLPVHYVHALTPFPLLEGGDRDALRDARAIVTGRVMPIDAASLDLAPRLRVVALHTSGTDNVDLRAASERGVVVTNVKGVNGGACAELAIGLVLAVTRQILRADRSIRAGRWTGGLAPSMGLEGATLGVIGLGRIGRAVVERAEGFGVRTIAHTPRPDADFMTRHRVESRSLEGLLAEADVVVLTASLTPQTRRMIGEREIRRMQPHAVFVNVARGELVDEAALVAALRDGAIAGAGIDVFEHEPLHDSPLFALDTVVVTPHMAGLTRDGVKNAAMRAARNAILVIEGGEAPDAVNALVGRG